MPGYVTCRRRSIAIMLAFGGFLVLLAGAASALAAEDYVVVDLVGANDPYYAAAECLAKLRDGEIVSSNAADLAKLPETLREKQPRYVALVVRPDDLDVNLARRFLELSTEIDDDPFVDFAYGFITGDTPETALSLAQRGAEAERNRREPTLAVAAVGEKAIARSAVSQQQFPLRRATLPQLWGQIAGGENFEQGRDAEFIQKLMPQLAGKSIVLFAGHGDPREVVGGPTWKNLDGIRFDGAVVLNIACLTGVTHRWFEEDWQAGVKRERTVPRDESFCLAMLKTGAAAYVAYACPRPAGPELFGDFAGLAAEGLSVGEVRRRDYNRVVLASLAAGFDRLKILHESDGQPIQPRKDLVRDLLLDMATGGIVFGDPKFTPFAARPDEVPTETKIDSTDEGLRVTVSIGPRQIFTECSDPLATWGEKAQALRVLTVVPLGRRYVRSVTLRELKMGVDVAEHRLTWAVEQQGDERFAHLKVSFPDSQLRRQLASLTGVRASFDIETTDDPAKARARFIEKDNRPGD